MSWARVVWRVTNTLERKQVERSTFAMRDIWGGKAVHIMFGEKRSVEKESSLLSWHYVENLRLVSFSGMIWGS